MLAAMKPLKALLVRESHVWIHCNAYDGRLTSGLPNETAADAAEILRLMCACVFVASDAPMMMPFTDVLVVYTCGWCRALSPGKCCLANTDDRTRRICQRNTHTWIRNKSASISTYMRYMYTRRSIYARMRTRTSVNMLLKGQCFRRHRIMLIVDERGCCSLTALHISHSGRSFEPMLRCVCVCACLFSRALACKKRVWIVSCTLVEYCSYTIVYLEILCYVYL